GHEVTEANNGQQGINQLQDNSFDLVITDILMPEKDGTEVILYLENLPERPAVLAMSGGGVQMPADMALMVAKTRADDVLQKPFENDALLEKVKDLLTKVA